MNKRHTLTLMELAVMFLVFALAAALCMQCFTRVELKNRENICRDRAMIQLQNAAEVLRQQGGDFAAAAQQHGGTWDGSRWILEFEEYRIVVQPEDTRLPCLGGARLEAIYRGSVLIALDLRWQEGSYEA